MGALHYAAGSHMLCSVAIDPSHLIQNRMNVYIIIIFSGGRG